VATNLELDPKLIDAVKLAGAFKTKREAVTAAMEEFLQRRKQLDVVKLFGTIEFDAKYDHKKARRR
jgi:Arc/MetJ family transcription regulator